MFCNQCGKEIEDGSKFCVYCGHSFEDEGTGPMDGGPGPAFEEQPADARSQSAGAHVNRGSAPLSTRDPVREQNYKKGILICIVVMVAALAAIVVIFASRGNKKPATQEAATTEAAAQEVATTEAATQEVATTEAATQEVQTEAATTAAAD